MYRGHWKVGIQNGYGEYLWSDGSKYTGYWQDGNPSGFGTWENDKVEHTGQWVDGKRHGKALVTNKKDGKVVFDGYYEMDQQVRTGDSKHKKPL